MSKTKIPEKTKLRLWGKAAGRCQYEGCNKALYFDPLTKAEFNTSYIAHIYADQPLGPRYDKELSPKLCKDISNLMLMCDEHHRLIDIEKVNEHPAERLFQMKALHEKRIEIQTSIAPDLQSHVILMGANIGGHSSPVNFREATLAMKGRYPADINPIQLGIKNSFLSDTSADYWRFQELELENTFNRQVLPLKGNHPVQHFSVFGLAPMPLLIKFGSLLNDIYPADIYQRHREPATWKWQEDLEVEQFQFKTPTCFSAVPVLKISLSATISDHRITSVLNEECSIWEITHDNPHNDFLRSKATLQKFRQIVRIAMDEIKIAHGQNSLLHIFPSMPVAAAIDFGRVWMPKADLPMKIYDQNKVTNSFTPTIQLN